jgi:hypothetical protein
MFAGVSAQNKGPSAIILPGCNGSQELEGRKAVACRYSLGNTRGIRNVTEREK